MDVASIGSAITGMKINSSISQVSTAMLAKSLDTLQDSGDSMIRMMENSVTPHLGGNFDMSV